MNATAKDLRFHSKALLNSVARGEEVVITYRGKPCAKLVPIAPVSRAKKSAKHPAFGMWKDHDGVKDVDAYVRSLRKGRFSC